MLSSILPGMPWCSSQLLAWSVTDFTSFISLLVLLFQSMSITDANFMFVVVNSSTGQPVLDKPINATLILKQDKGKYIADHQMLFFCLLTDSPHCYLLPLKFLVYYIKKVKCFVPRLKLSLLWELEFTTKVFGQSHRKDRCILCIFSLVVLFKHLNISCSSRYASWTVTISNNTNNSTLSNNINGWVIATSHIMIWPETSTLDRCIQNILTLVEKNFLENSTFIHNLSVWPMFILFSVHYVLSISK